MTKYSWGMGGPKAKGKIRSNRLRRLKGKIIIRKALKEMGLR